MSVKKQRKNDNRNGFFSRIWKYILKNHLQLVGILLAILALIVGYWAISEPEIRFLNANNMLAKFKQIDKKIDENGNYIYYFTCSVKFKNLSIRSGFIDKVEISPLSIKTIPESKILYINKTPFGFREERQIETTFLITIPSAVILNLERSDTISLYVTLNYYDNFGKIINKFDSGPYKWARITIDLKQKIKVEIKDILIK